MLEHQNRLDRFADQRQRIHRLWNIDEETGLWLINKIKEINPKNILEIGTSNGYSTFCLWQGMDKNMCSIISLEVDLSRHTLAKENLQGLENLELLLGKAEDLLPQLKQQFDFIFIDAGKINYIDYLEILLKNQMLADNAVIVADNVISHTPTVQRYLDLVLNSPIFKTEILDLGAGLAITYYHKL